MAATQADAAQPPAETGSTLFLAQFSTPVEERLLREWMHGREFVPLPDPRAGSEDGVDALAERLWVDPHRAVVPVHVAWLPPARDGKRRARLTDLLLGRDPYQPSERQQRRLAERQPDLAQVVVGDSATVAQLRARWLETTVGGDERDFARFVIRRANLALERADYRLLGPQYKAPKLVKEEILSSARFRDGLQNLRQEIGADRATLEEQAGWMLDELATGWSRMFVDVFPRIGRFIFERGYDPDIDYDAKQIARLRAALQRHPAVLLWSHRSHLDSLVLTVAMREHGLPPAHLFAGINMSFGPVGATMRRAGVIFIRRTADDPVYRFVLRQYVRYLVEKRFNLSWSIEGTRSRTGKMLPPKLGLLSYVADVYLEGHTDDVVLLPVSISFDQLHEIGEYAAYAGGAEKQPESVRWLIRTIRAQGERHYGKIYVRFPEPVSMRSFLGPPNGPVATDPDARRLAMQKMAFEAAWRMNQATPVNATALVTTVLLAVRGVALTLDQMHRALADALDYLEERHIPTTSSVAGLRTLNGVQATLNALSPRGGPVTQITGGRQPVWCIRPEHQLAAAFYRNSLVHAFLDSAICELALLQARDATADPLDAYWSAVLRLRDLLKFEFYFEDSKLFRTRVAAEMSQHDPRWQQRVSAGGDEITGLVSSMRPLTSQTVLRPFLEAYSVVADVLTDEGAEIDEKTVISRALGVGRQYVAQGRLGSSESVSALLFKTALQVADNQGLLRPSADLAERRRAFLTELRAVARRTEEIDQIAMRRFWADVTQTSQG